MILSPFKDHPLKDIVEALEKERVALARAYFMYLDKEAEREHYTAQLIDNALNLGDSHAASVVKAKKTLAWLTFHKELARLEAIYNFHKLKFSVLDKEYFAQSQALKLDSEMIKKQL